MSKKRVLILCTGNSARSQMANGLVRHMAGEDFEVFSAFRVFVGGAASRSTTHSLLTTRIQPPRRPKLT